MQLKLDLHTHSVLSKDGGLSEKDYERLLQANCLDYIAITDHNEIALAELLHEKLGDKIIVGEEILSKEGEIVGLFLIKKVPANLAAKETVKQIHEQDGLVYIPHPFETVRKGLQKKSLEQIASDIDIMEVYNGRSWQKRKANPAHDFAVKHKLVQAASSDAHCRLGIGKTYSTTSKIVTKETLLQALQEGSLMKQPAPILSYLCPKVNVLMKKFRKNPYAS